MTDAAGVPERAAGKPTGRMFTIRRSLLTTVEATLSRLADHDAMGKIPSFAYDDMGEERVKIQLTVYRAEGDK